MLGVQKKLGTILWERYVATEDSGMDVIFVPSLGAELNNKVSRPLPDKMFLSMSNYFNMGHARCKCGMSHLQRWKDCDLDLALDEARRLVLGFNARADRSSMPSVSTAYLEVPRFRKWERSGESFVTLLTTRRRMSLVLVLVLL